jgi:uncharacterized membrane protein
MMPMMYPFGGQFGLLLGLVMLGLIAAGVLALVWMADGSTAPQMATQVLRERYAHGEIDSEEYRARLDALTSSSGGRR